MRAFAIASVAAFAMSYWVGATGAVLQTAASPLGIVSLELAGTPAVAQQIYAAWGESGHRAAQYNIKIDFLYLMVYGVALSIGCAVARRWWLPRSVRLAQLGAALTWMMLVAAASDACENAMMWHAIHDTTNALWPALARVFAIGKFALIAVGLLYILCGAVSRMWHRRSAHP